MNDRTFPRRILVPLDGSDLAAHALPYARALATDNTEVILCRVVRDPASIIRLAGPVAIPFDRIRAPRIREAEEYLANAAEALASDSVRVATVSAVGSPPDEVLRAATVWDADLIVMTTHGRGFLGRVVIGSVADRVARAADKPVLLVRERKNTDPAVSARIARLVVPLDGSELARQALPVAARLAEHLALPIHLISALPTVEEITPHDDTLALGFYDRYVEAVVESLRAEASQISTEATSSVIIGPPVEAILEEVGDNDVVVMTSHGHGGMRRWWIGSVAERLAHIGKTPLMLVPVRDGQGIEY